MILGPPRETVVTLTVRARNFGGVVRRMSGICRMNWIVIIASRTEPLIMADIIICDSKSNTETEFEALRSDR